MRLTQSNKLTMFEAVINYLEERTGIVNSIAEFAVSFTEFKTAAKSISEKEVERQTASAGKTNAKYSAEEELIDSTVDVGAGLFTYSRKNKIAESKELSDISERKLGRLKDVDLLNKCTQVYNAAKNVESELAPFGVTAELVEGLRSKIAAFELSIGDRNASAAKRKGAGKTVVEMFNEADDILEEELDRFVDKFKTRDTDFYEGYYAARNIKNLGVRHRAPEEPVIPS